MSGEDTDATLQGLVDGLCSIDFESAVTVMTSVLQARPELAPPVINFAVPDLTYPPSKALIDRRAEGWVKSFHESKGFGFIECEELYDTFASDVFLHHSQLGSFQTGQAVSFAVMLSKDSRPQAYDLQPLESKGGGKGKGGAAAYKGGGGDGGWGAKGDASWYGKGDGGWGKGDGGWGGGKDAWGGGKDAWGKSDGGWGKGDGGWGGGCKGNGGSYGPSSKGGSGAKGGSKGGKGDDAGKSRKGSGKAGGIAFITDDAEPIGEFQGTIKSFNQNNGYGFIDCPDLKDMYGNDTFLYKKDLGSFEVGEVVSFTAFVNSLGKPQAKGLQGTSGSKRSRNEV